VKATRFNRQRKKSTDTNDSDDFSDVSGGEEFDLDDDAAKPVISNEGYYWIGKDYSNSYIADFKDIADFSRGLSLNI
jgi:hypothetical protein